LQWPAERVACTTAADGGAAARPSRRARRRAAPPSASCPSDTIARSIPLAQVTDQAADVQCSGCAAEESRQLAERRARRDCFPARPALCPRGVLARSLVTDGSKQKPAPTSSWLATCDRPRARRRQTAPSPTRTTAASRWHPSAANKGPLARWTSSDSAALTSTGCSVRVRAVVSPSLPPCSSSSEAATMIDANMPLRAAPIGQRQPREHRRPCAPPGQSRSSGPAPDAPDRRDRRVAIGLVSRAPARRRKQPRRFVVRMVRAGEPAVASPVIGFTRKHASGRGAAGAPVRGKAQARAGPASRLQLLARVPWIG
jgi:hypothetical protein